MRPHRRSGRARGTGGSSSGARLSLYAPACSFGARPKGEVMATGITKLHSKGCPARDGRRCNCGGGYEAGVFSKRDGKKIRKTFASEAEAKTWRADALSALSRGGL